MSKKTQWDWEIKSGNHFFQVSLGELSQYKDLLLRFVRRDLMATYQQTIIGPVWIFLQPLLTTLVYSIVFGRIARLSTDGLPGLLFYFPGIILWNFFSDCLTEIMYTFIKNAAVFNKVYFPRILVPLSSILVQSIRFSIQLLVFLCIYGYYLLHHQHIAASWYVLLTPLLMLMTAALALGTGLLMSVIMAKYRDMENVFHFGLRLFMFATPVFYAASIVPAEYRFVFWLNPLTVIIETWRAAFFGVMPVPFHFLGIASVEIFILLTVGLLLFKKRERTVMDII